MAGDPLSNAALNRALLARQDLLERARRTVPKEIERLVGLQAQEPKDPYVALWSRLHAFDPRKLGRLIETGKAGRLALMRSTLHLVTARDARALRPAIEPVLDAWLRHGFARTVRGADLDLVAKAARDILGREALTFAELGERLASRWPGRDPQALAMVARGRLSLVQAPPRGVWGKSGAARHRTAESWLRAPAAAPLSVDGLVLRYLAAFGPASVQDAQMWSGLTRLGESFQRLSPKLKRFTSPEGATLYDLPRAPRPEPDAPAPPRFLPVYDNLLLGHRDRSRMFDPQVRLPPVPENALVRHALIDGLVAARWEVVEAKRATTLRVRVFRRLRAGEKSALQDEASRLLDFLKPEAPGKQVRVA